MIGLVRRLGRHENFPHGVIAKGFGPEVVVGKGARDSKPVASITMSAPGHIGWGVCIDDPATLDNAGRLLISAARMLTEVIAEESGRG
jgi:hypothetical protein